MKPSQVLKALGILFFLSAFLIAMVRAKKIGKLGGRKFVIAVITGVLAIALATVGFILDMLGK